MELPEIITRLPQAVMPFPASALRTSVLQSPNGQLVFFDVREPLVIPPHSHQGQWGTVLEGEVEITMNGETRTYRPGASYYIAAGVVHSARVPAGAKIIEFFEEPDRYAVR